jgi:hypothetical protein
MELAAVHFYNNTLKAIFNRISLILFFLLFNYCNWQVFISTLLAAENCYHMFFWVFQCVMDYYVCVGLQSIPNSYNFLTYTGSDLGNLSHCHIELLRSTSCPDVNCRDLSVSVVLYKNFYTYKHSKIDPILNNARKC